MHTCLCHREYHKVWRTWHLTSLQWTDTFSDVIIISVMSFSTQARKLQQLTILAGNDFEGTRREQMFLFYFEYVYIQFWTETQNVDFKRSTLMGPGKDKGDFFTVSGEIPGLQKHMKCRKNNHKTLKLEIRVKKNAH